MKRKQSIEEVKEFLFGTDRPARDTLGPDIAARLVAHLEPLIERLKTVQVATQVGYNWKNELIRVAGRLNRLAVDWPHSKSDMSAPAGKAWCIMCEAYAAPSDCTYSTCPIAKVRISRVMRTTTADDLKALQRGRNRG
jgi:hypothetical protein